MTFTPMPYRLSPETFAARQENREAKLNQTFDETVREVRRERKAAQKLQLRKIIRRSSAERATDR